MSSLIDLRKDLKRYTELRFWIGDAAMREHLTRLIEETRAKIAELTQRTATAKTNYRP
jgi:hypothetical protein